MITKEDYEKYVAILEEELVKLASEKQQMERKKEFYSRVSDFEREHTQSARESVRKKVVRGDMFFTGVGNKQSLKKRYKDLIKIYHPDNLDGDKDTIQEINREYDHLSKFFMM